jgi:hypothetical protein
MRDATRSGWRRDEREAELAHGLRGAPSSGAS